MLSVDDIHHPDRTRLNNRDRGRFVDASVWQGVFDLLTSDGFHVSVVQNRHGRSQAP